MPGGDGRGPMGYGRGGFGRGRGIGMGNGPLRNGAGQGYAGTSRLGNFWQGTCRRLGGLGRGLGLGRGFGAGFAGAGSPQNESDLLKNRIDALQEEIDFLKKRNADLQSEDPAEKTGE